jgi:hypothetical protein
LEIARHGYRGCIALNNGREIVGWNGSPESILKSDEQPVINTWISAASNQPEVKAAS